MNTNNLVSYYSSNFNDYTGFFFPTPNSTEYEEELEHQDAVDLESLDDCCVCFDALNPLESGKKAVLQHTGEGHKHPIHRECIQQVAMHAIAHPKCPTCQLEFDASSVFSWQERSADWISEKLKGAALAVSVSSGLLAIFQGVAFYQETEAFPPSFITAFTVGAAAYGVLMPRVARQE